VSADGRPVSQAQQPPPGSPGRLMTVAGLLAAAIVAWSAVPLAGGGPGTRVALLAAACCAVLSVLQLAVSRVQIGDDVYGSLAAQAARRMAAVVSAAPWPEAMMIAALALEALHPARPWHTAVLAVAVIAFLLAVHCAESKAPPRVLRAQLPLLAAGVGMTVLAAGAAALPGLGTGPAAVLLRVLAAVAALIVGALAVPV
jgi:hypothetical protein